MKSGGGMGRRLSTQVRFSAHAVGATSQRTESVTKAELKIRLCGVQIPAPTSCEPTAETYEVIREEKNETNRRKL
jgi:hypothetical protein